MSYKITNNTAPSYLNDLLLYNDVNNYNLRRSKFNVIIPKPKTNYKKRSFSYRGAIEWNKLDQNIQVSPNLSIFISRLKRMSQL